MGYQKTVWDENTPITPARLNKLETQYDEVLNGYVCISGQIDEVMTSRSRPGSGQVDQWLGQGSGLYFGLPTPSLANLFESTTVLRWDTKTNLQVWKRFSQIITVEVGNLQYYNSAGNKISAKFKITVEFPSLGKGPFTLYEKPNYSQGPDNYSVTFSPAQFTDFNPNANMRIQLHLSATVTGLLLCTYDYFRAKCNRTMSLVPKG